MLHRPGPLLALALVCLCACSSKRAGSGPPKFRIVDVPAAESDLKATLAREATFAQVADALKETNVKALALTDAISRIASDQKLAEDPNVSFVIGALTGKIPLVESRLLVPEHGLDERATQMIATLASSSILRVRLFMVLCCPLQTSERGALTRGGLAKLLWEGEKRITV